MNSFKKATYIAFSCCVLAFMILLGMVLGGQRINAQLTDRVSQSNNFYDDWKGKKVAWYGDSLTELYYHCDIVNQYFEFDGYNCGIRGCAISNVGDNAINLCHESRLKFSGLEIPEDVDVIIIMAGTNDWCGNVELGDKKLTFNGNGQPNVDDTTFYGACHQMFYNITKNYPHAYVLVAGTPFIANKTYNLYNEAGLTCFDYGDALCEAAGMWGIQSFNISRMMGINVNNVQDAGGEMYEELHFTEGAGRKAADVFIQEICSRRWYN